MLKDYEINKPVLETDRLIIRTLNEADVPDLKEWLGRDEIYTYWGRKASKNEKNPELMFIDARPWVKRKPSPDFDWGIVLKETNTVIGMIAVFDIQNSRMGDIGYRIHPEYWNMGITTEALKEVIRFIFENTEIERLNGRADVRNIASNKVLERCGFIKEGTIRQGKMVSVYCDYNIYGMLREDYAKIANRVHRQISVCRDINEWIDGGFMKKATRKQLANIAKEMAQLPFHGFEEGEASNLEPIIQPFPKWTLEEADRLWCAAFVYYCCREAGFDIPIRPDECKTCHLAGCIAWEEFAKGNSRIEYHPGGEGFVPEAGDIVLYDRVFENREHDHIGIVIEKRENTILAAEGNIDNRSGMIERPLDEHIRAYIRIPDGFHYKTE